MATRDSSEVERRRLRVRDKRTQTPPPTPANSAATGSLRARNSARAGKAPPAKRSSPRKRTSARHLRATSGSPVKARAIPFAVQYSIDRQRGSLSAAMSLLYCLHSELRRRIEDGGPIESEAVEDAAEWVDLTAITSMLLVQLHSIHLGLDSISLRKAAESLRIAEMANLLDEPAAEDSQP